MPKSKKVSIDSKRLKKLVDIADWIMSCDNKEYDDYVNYCDDNGLDPAKINGREQSKHVYAKALISLNMTFPKE